MTLALLSMALAAPEPIPEAAWNAATHADASSGADFDIPLRGGGTFRMADHTGHRVLLTFWASWCGPCRKELPALSAWAKTHPEVTVLAVNVDRTSADADGFLQKVAVDLPVAYDPEGARMSHYGVASMPTMFLFDGAGMLAWRHSGYGEEQGLTELDAALAGAR